MATRKVAMSNTAWTLVTAVAFGTLENKTSGPLLFRFDTALPSAGLEEGHDLHPNARYVWTLTVAQNLYARIPAPTANTAGQGYVLISD
jgi:hypothetical protein